MQWILGKLNEALGFVIALIGIGIVFGLIWWALTDLDDLFHLASTIFGGIAFVISHAMDFAKAAAHWVSTLF